jgi:hypothetical protein
MRWLPSRLRSRRPYLALLVNSALDVRGGLASSRVFINGAFEKVERPSFNHALM